MPLALVALAGCGGGTNSYKPTEGHAGTTGPEGQGSALPADPEAARKKIQSLQAKQRASGDPPGR